jgi:hypothetical protein
MVNNSITSINKSNNRLLPQIIEHKKDHKITLEINVLAWERHKNMVELNRLIGYKPSPLDIWISNGSTYINKRFIDPAIVLSMFMLSFIDPAIVLSMFMLSFIDHAIVLSIFT